jgi:protein Mpv17
MMETPQKTWNWGRKQLEDIDANGILNASVVALLSVVILAKLTMVDADMSRGWTVEELATRTAVDIWEGYLHVLRNSPIATKAATSATVYTIGDIIAQRTEGANMGDLDRPRILRSMLAGFIGHGPLSHFWYEISEHFFDNVAHLTQWWAFIPKVVVDQSVWGPIWYVAL